MLCFLLFSFKLANHENPELIWNDDAREKVSQTSQKFRDAYVTIAIKNVTITVTCVTNAVTYVYFCLLRCQRVNTFALLTQCD